jgi:GNAT superfamily N-acetyltransferase
VTTIRPVLLPGPDAAAVGRLVGDYLRVTEQEKAARGLAPDPGDGPLPPRYQLEVDDPAAAFAGATVLLATRGGADVGVVVVARDAAGDGELKRLWVDPSARGAGVARALLDHATALVAGAVRLTVWDWRAPAIRAYRRHGFAPVAAWDGRERLVCLERRRP